MRTEPETIVDLDALEFSWPDGAFTLEIDRLTIAAGERVFIHGPSGSGKSTLLGLIAGIHQPDAGRVSVLGRELASMGAGARDRLRGAEMGFVFQQFNLIGYLSVLDNVLLPLAFSVRRRERCGGSADAGRQAADLLARLGLSEELYHRRPEVLSVGQQQRVAVARALLGSPRLIICDEPTSALDSDARDAFLDLLIAECDASDAAVLFVSHDVALAAHFDRSVALADFLQEPGE